MPLTKTPEPAIIARENEEPTAKKNTMVNTDPAAERKRPMDHIEWLTGKLHGYERELARARTDAERLPGIIANIKGTIQALTGSNGKASTNGNHPGSTNRPGGFQVKTLQRRPEFETLSNAEAVKKVLDESTEPLTCQNWQPGYSLTK